MTTCGCCLLSASCLPLFFPPSTHLLLPAGGGKQVGRDLYPPAHGPVRVSPFFLPDCTFFALLPSFWPGLWQCRLRCHYSIHPTPKPSTLFFRGDGMACSMAPFPNTTCTSASTDCCHAADALRCARPFFPPTRPIPVHSLWSRRHWRAAAPLSFAPPPPVHPRFPHTLSPPIHGGVSRSLSCGSAPCVSTHSMDCAAQSLARAGVCWAALHV